MKKLIFSRWLRASAFIVTMLLCSVSMYAQNSTIRGRVVSASDQSPLTGATVVDLSTNRGVTTNLDGEFSLQSKDAATLSVSYIGYATVEVAAKTGNMTIELEENARMIDDVVVTGYSSERKADITGAVSVVKMDDIIGGTSGNVMSAIQGRVAGMNISSNGTPGGMATSTQVRGITTINNSTPLYVIDGVQTRDNLATLLNPNDIESMQILKDAASASIYGTQAANGVIIITTKKSKEDRVNVVFDAKMTINTPQRGHDMLNAEEWGEVYWDAYNNAGIAPKHDIYGKGETPVIPEFIDLNQTIKSGDTDWFDEVTDTSISQDYNVSVMRGGKRGSSLLSLNYLDDVGTVKNTNFQRVNARVNSDYNFLDNRFRIGENLTVSNWQTMDMTGGLVETALAQHPIIPVYDINGGYAGPTQGLGDKPNPVRLADQQANNENKQWRIFSNVFAELEPIKDLVIRTSYGLNFRTGRIKNVELKWQEGDRKVDKNSVYQKADYDMSWVWSNTANYNKTIGKHTFGVLAGMEAQNAEYGHIDGKREDYIIEDPNYLYLTSGDGKQINSGISGSTSMLSYFGKVNYQYDNRYLASVTIRRDASSRFGVNNSFGTFPAVSLGWRVSQEAFMEDVDWLDELKVRATWGKNGNDQMDNEATYTKYYTDLNLGGYDIAGVNTGTIPNGLVKQRTGNPSVMWEVTTQTNLGVDLEMLDRRLTFTADVYRKQTDGMLIDRPYVGVIGEGGYMAYNGAGIQNDGVELTAGWRDNINKDWSYNVTLNTAFYRNEITELPEDIYYTWGGGNPATNTTIVGQPFGSWMGYVADGLYRTDEELDNGIDQPGKGLGRIRYKDLNGDNVINDKDREWLGSDQPKMIAGLNFEMRYKQFDFSMFWNGMVRDAYNNSKFYTDFFQLWTGNHGTALLDAWTPENFDSTIPALTPNNANDEARTSTYFIENGSYLKLKTLQLGYTLPTDVTSKLCLTNARVYVMGQNLLTLTKYTGVDPENLGYPYPLPTTFIVGVNFGF